MLWPRAITALLILGSVASTGVTLRFAIGGVRKRWLRIVTCVVLTIPTWYAITVPWIRNSEWKLSDGRWCCLVCGALERRITYGGSTLWTHPAEDSDVTKEPRRFEEWYWRTVRVSHEHDWMPVGCRDYLLSAVVGCVISYGQAYFGALPSLPNPDIAAWMVNRMVHADPAERRRLIRPLGLVPPDELFGTVERGAVQWQGEHTEWK